LKISLALSLNLELQATPPANKIFFDLNLSAALTVFDNNESTIAS
jgi:hypothetical protein